MKDKVMIKRVAKIKKFGSFNDFTWNSQIPDFKKFNLIYGWNYSGKTTLSRIFQCFENQYKHPDFENSEFSLIDKDSSSYNEYRLDFPFPIRVFNTDFVKNNIKWDEELESIVLIGKENIELQNKLSELNKQLEIVNSELNELEKNYDPINNKIEDGKTKTARSIKNDFNIPNFDKRNFQEYIDNTIDSPTTYILSEEKRQDLRKQYFSTEIHEKLPLIHYLLGYFDYEDLYQECKRELSVIVFAEIINKLKDNKELSDWVETGIKLHKDKTTCEFCGNRLPLDLFDVYSKHFSEEYELLKIRIDKLVNALDKINHYCPVKNLRKPYNLN
nr:AAA family ATPase [Bacteroidota bacterium]